jgi:hypothetical protein
MTPAWPQAAYTRLPRASGRCTQWSIGSGSSDADASWQLRNHPGVRRIGDVEDRGPVGRRHVANIGVRAIDDDLPSAGQVEIPHSLQCRGNRLATHASPDTTRCVTIDPRSATGNSNSRSAVPLREPQIPDQLGPGPNRTRYAGVRIHLRVGRQADGAAGGSKPLAAKGAVHRRALG